MSDPISDPSREATKTTVGSAPAGPAAELTLANSAEGSYCPSALPKSEIGKAEIGKFFPARVVARATGWSKKTVQRTAARDLWPAVMVGNRIEYAVPSNIAARCAALVEKPLPGPAPTVKFVDLTHNDLARKKVLLREEAVKCYLERVESGYGIEFSLSAAVAHAFRRGIEMGLENFAVGGTTVRQWVKAWRAHGLDGLVEQKLGRVGAKSAMSNLEEDDRVEFVKRGKALALEHGSGGRPNVARAAQEMATHPDLAAPLRGYLNGARASKSSVTPSIRAALTPSPLTTVLAQIGTKAARLSSSFTPGDYSDVRAGDVFVSDDMTSNVIAWCEWPNRLGYRVGQPQLLPVMDVGSLRWLNFRLIMRESGQYNAHDDIAGLFGDVFDAFGLPKDGFLLEGGHWQSDVVRGLRTGLSNEERIGGLCSLGLKIYRAFGPTGKAVIEGAFNQLQHAADAFPGFAGREQRHDGVETVQKQLALVRSGQEHPRRWFPHVSELADHVHNCMEKLNLERNDGIILRGECPIDKWANDAPVLKAIPESAKWLYRSAMSVTKVTRNGIRVTLGSGAKLLVYYYDNAEVLVPRVGQRVVCYWNHANPEADVILLSAQKPRLFLGTAQYVQPLKRFGATDEQLAAEAARKKASMHYARTELRSVQTELQRTRDFVPVDGRARGIGSEIARANARAEKEKADTMNYERAAAKVAARVRTVTVAPDEETETLPPRQTAPAGGISEEELNEL